MRSRSRRRAQQGGVAGSFRPHSSNVGAEMRPSSDSMALKSSWCACCHSTRRDLRSVNAARTESICSVLTPDGSANCARYSRTMARRGTTGASSRPTQDESRRALPRQVIVAVRARSRQHECPDPLRRVRGDVQGDDRAVAVPDEHDTPASHRVEEAHDVRRLAWRRSSRLWASPTLRALGDRARRRGTHRRVLDHCGKCRRITRFRVQQDDRRSGACRDRVHLHTLDRAERRLRCGALDRSHGALTAGRARCRS